MTTRTALKIARSRRRWASTHVFFLLLGGALGTGLRPAQWREALARELAARAQAADDVRRLEEVQRPARMLLRHLRGELALGYVLAALLLLALPFVVLLGDSDGHRWWVEWERARNRRDYARRNIPVVKQALAA